MLPCPGSGVESFAHSRCRNCIHRRAVPVSRSPFSANLPEISMNFIRCCHDRALSH